MIDEVNSFARSANISWTGLNNPDMTLDGPITDELNEIVNEFGGFDTFYRAHDPQAGIALAKDGDRVLCVMSNSQDVLWFEGTTVTSDQIVGQLAMDDA